MTLFRGRYRIESARLPGWDYASPGWYFVTLCTRNRAWVFGDVVRGRMRLSPIGRVVAEEWCRTGTIRDDVDLDAWVVMPNHLHGIIRITRSGPVVGDGAVTAVGDGAVTVVGDGAVTDVGGGAVTVVVETPRRGVSTDVRRPDRTLRTDEPDVRRPDRTLRTDEPDVRRPYRTLRTDEPDVRRPYRTLRTDEPDVRRPDRTLRTDDEPCGCAAERLRIGTSAGLDPTPTVGSVAGLDPSRLRPRSLGATIGQFKSICTKRIRAAGHVEFAWQARFHDSILRDAAAVDRVRRYIANNPARWERDRNNPPGLFI